jgi:hypothetical protein
MKRQLSSFDSRNSNAGFDQHGAANGKKLRKDALFQIDGELGSHWIDLIAADLDGDLKALCSMAGD